MFLRGSSLLGCISFVIVSAAGQQSTEHVSSVVMVGRLLSKGALPGSLDLPTHSGCVVYTLQVDANGNVIEALPVSGPEDLRQPVVDAVRQWKFKPILRNGVPVPVSSTMSTCLNVDGPPRVYAAPSPIKMSSGVAAGQIAHKVAPVFPASAKQAGISGATVVHVLIDEEGNVVDATIVSGPQALRESVLTAVRQWKYKPYLLNGAAVPIDTVVTISVSLGA